MARRHYTNEEKEYLREIVPGHRYREIAELFNAKFPEAININQVEVFIRNNNLNTGRKKMPHIFTEEEKAYMREIAPGHSQEEIAELFNAKFQDAIDINQVGRFIRKFKLYTGRIGRFPKGYDSRYRLQKGCHIGKETEFKKGAMPPRYMPVGSTRVNSDGYTLIKIEDPKKWRSLHVYEWEKVNGPVPKGSVVIFGDGNKQNFAIDNLILVKQSELAVLNRRHLISTSTELTKTSVAFVKLKEKIVNSRKGR